MTVPGRQIGRYRLLEQLGSGGMSVVFKGLDTALDREVAVKVLHPHLAQKDEARKRLAREARAVARLHHPNILEVFDFSAEGSEDAYIVTEYIRGQTLRQFCNEQLFQPPEVAAMVVHGLAEALAHAHEAGIIHRDLKPENAMVRSDGVLKLMDFGIAKIIDRDERMTMTGALVGSPAHMAPEIVEGEEARPQSDVFSLGTMLYLFATGKLPFTGANTTSVLKKILDASYEDPLALCPALSDGLQEIIARCLARRPEDRYPAAGALRDALGAYLRELGIVRVGEELAAFFADPAGYRAALVGRLSTLLLERGEQQVQQGKMARALATLNQVLGLDPGNARAIELLDSLNRAKRRRRRLQRIARVSGLALIVAGIAAGTVAGYRSLSPPEPPTNAATTPPEVTTPAAVDPKPPDPKPPEVKTADVRTAEVKPAEATPPDPRPASATIERRAREPARPAQVPITIQVRPFGHITVDRGPRSAEALALHSLAAEPGPHRVVVSCEHCVDEVETITVKPGAENLFRLRAALKPSTLAFEVQPAGAIVRIGEQARPASESAARPFAIESPKGPTTMQHRVEYVISMPGYRTIKKQIAIAPGELTVVRERMVAE